MRNESKYFILQSILREKIYGKRIPGRRRISWLQNLRIWFGSNSSELFCVTTDRESIAGMVIRNRKGTWKRRKYSFICNTFKNTIIKTTYQYYRWIYFKKQTGWKVRKLNFQKFNINSKYYNILYAVHKSKFGNSLINLI